MSQYDITVTCQGEGCTATRRIVCSTADDRRRALGVRWYCWRHK